MKKFTFFIFVFWMIICNSHIFALGTGFDPNSFNDELNELDIPVNQSIVDVGNNIVGKVILIIQILAVFGIVFCGVRYMFAGASKKAELKNSLVSIAIGSTILFAGSTIAQIINSIFNDL